MKKFATGIAAVTLLGATLAFAAPHDGGGEGRGHGKRGGFDQKLAQELGLSDAQKEQIRAIRKDSYEQNKAFFEQSRATMKQLWDAKEANDTAKLDALKPALDAQRAQMQQIRAAEEAKIATVLTAEQNAKWQQLKAERASRHRDQQ
ncbi:MAG TPA: Spy/CpxP family protein refolding chaperone [Thermoanaerobaculia bacterium]|nr:Spy/CpxP family protein refolding chaperone [Thermoanaerobaculia bacterium]